MKYSGIIGAGLICLFAAYLLVSSFSITSEAGAALGPAFMPRILGIILLVLGAADLAEEIRQERKRGRNAAAAEKWQTETGKNRPDGMGKPAGTAAAGPQDEGGEAAAMTGGLSRRRAWIAGHVDVLSIPLLLAYAYTMKSAGFLLSSGIYMFLHMLLLTVDKKRNYPLLILLAVLVPCIIYFCFVKLFYLMLPAGILG